MENQKQIGVSYFFVALKVIIVQYLHDLNSTSTALDLKKGVVVRGKPDKADTTLTIEDKDMVQLVRNRNSCIAII